MLSKPSLQDWMDEALRRIDGPPKEKQTSLAKAIRERFKIPCTPQAIEYLAARRAPAKGGSPAKRSHLTAYIAEIVGMPLPGVWKPEQNANSAVGIAVGAKTVSRYSVERPEEIDGVEYTKQALQVAKAFMDLPRNRRDDYQREIETEALRFSSRKPDPREAQAVKAKAKK